MVVRGLNEVSVEGRGRPHVRVLQLFKRRRPTEESPLRRLATDWTAAEGTFTASRLNAIATAIGAQSYLEIGVREGMTLEAVDVAYRVGVDPVAGFDQRFLPEGTVFHAMTSDTFFRTCEELTFDIVLVDGLHEFEQSYRDLIASLAVLRPGGVVLLDDVVPADELSATKGFEAALDAADRLERPLDAWMGDVYKTAHLVTTEHPELAWRTIVGTDGRPQMLVWRSASGILGPVRPVGRRTIAAAEGLTYAGVFADGIPPDFRATDLESLLAEIPASSASGE